jgi:hypothetical protein
MLLSNLLQAEQQIRAELQDKVVQTDTHHCGRLATRAVLGGLGGLHGAPQQPMQRFAVSALSYR